MHSRHHGHGDSVQAASSCRTLIIHGSLSEDSWSRSLSLSLSLSLSINFDGIKVNRLWEPTSFVSFVASWAAARRRVVVSSSMSHSSTVSWFSIVIEFFF